MFRVALIYQLVLSLLVGPMLCCCATARSGHDSNPSTPHVPASERSQRKSCCGEQTPCGEEHPGPTNKPAFPSKCPCKNGALKAIVVPDNSKTVEVPSNLDTGLDFALGAGPYGDLSRVIDPSDKCLNHLSASPSKAELLYAHHKLRC
jgi:hypothetical protein